MAHNIFKTLSIVIPAYNEDNYILTTIEKVVASDTLGLTKEIIIVDDASSDQTVKISKKLQRGL